MLAKCSHIAVPALDGLADHRGRDLIGDLDVPNFAFALRDEVGEQLRDDRHIANLVAAHRRRRETFGAMIRMIPEQHLRHPYERSADTAWAIGSIDVALLLRTVLEWDSAQYAQWLNDTLVDQLLRPD